MWRSIAVPALAALAIALTTPARLATAQGAGSPNLTTLEGEVVMLVEDDFAQGRSINRHFLDDKRTGQRHELELTPQQAKALKPRMKVRVKGKLAGGTLSVDAAGDSVQVLGSEAAAAPLSVRKAVILLVDIIDANNVKHAISSTCDGTIDTAAAITFGFNTTAAQVDGCYLDSSFGALGVGGASYPGTDLDVRRVTINDAVTACNYTAWGSKADAAAGSLTSYQHRVYVVPSDVNCGWAGLAYVDSCPGPNCQAWVKAYSGQVCGYPDAIAHEMAHNLGLMHASTDTNNDGAADCEYCDDSDFMGYAEGNLRPLNGPHRVQMGWVSGAGVINATAGGQFTLAPLNQYAAPLPQVARIVTPNGDPYYVSYRTAIGYDSLLSSTVYSSGVLNKISIHRWAGGIDNTFFMGALGEGQAFTDTANSVTIVQNSHTASGATFTVSVGLMPPGNFTATAGNAQVSLSWSASAGATGYNIKRATVSGGPYVTFAANYAGTSWVDMGLTNGQTYYYVVSASSGANQSGDSAQVAATPNGIDLVTTTLSNPPAAASPGSTFSVSDTVKNGGAAAAGASTSRYYLSTNQPKDGADVLLAGSRSVPGLAAGASSAGSVTVTIPASTPGGTYYLLGCADDLVSVSETDENNNCRASTTTLQITLSDLIVSTLTIPSAPIAPGATLQVTHTVKNQGAVSASASTVRFYLSADQSKDAGDILLTTTRSVGTLAADASSNANTTVTVPANMAPGLYYVLGCADDMGAVAEVNEVNNCRASASTIQVARPDLLVTAVSTSATSVNRSGRFKLSDTTRNQGTVASGASTTRYYLSTDKFKGAGDVLLSGSRAISNINAGSNSSGTVNVNVPSATAPGTYYIVACSDDAGTVGETDETNNCLASTNTLVVR